MEELHKHADAKPRESDEKAEGDAGLWQFKWYLEFASGSLAFMSGEHFCKN